MGVIIFVVLLLIAAAAIVIAAEKAYKAWAIVPLLLAPTVLIISAIRIISPGMVAVPVTFGSVGTPTGSGIHLVAPWTKLHQISVRTQQYTMVSTNGEGNVKGDDSIAVLGADAATANVDATLLYHIDKAQAGAIYRTLGGDYVEKIVRPTSRTCIRNAFAGVAIVNAATDQRTEVAATIKDCLDTSFKTRGLVLEDFQLRNIALSAELQKAVDAKVAAQQVAAQKVFELQQAEADGRITTIGAKATADKQQILACGGVQRQTKDSTGKLVDVVIPNGSGHCDQTQLTPAFLELQRIQALQNLVNAPNNSVIVVPENFNGILNLPNKK